MVFRKSTVLLPAILLLWAWGVFLAGWPVSEALAQPVILEGPFVSDVTPRSFSVAWICSEPADPSLMVYDEAGREITEQVAQVPFPTMEQSETLKGYARNAGVMKVRVEQLSPDTVYLFKTVTDGDSGTLTYPSAEPVEVRTEARTDLVEDEIDKFPAGNNLVRFQVFQPDGTSPARGSLLAAWEEGASYPVTAYVGDGSAGDGDETGLVVLDLNNLYDGETRGTLIPGAEAVLKLKVFRGFGVQGNTLLHFRNVPAYEGTVSVVLPYRGYFADFNCDGNVDLLDGTLFAGSWGMSLGDGSYNSDYDLNGDDAVDVSDNSLFVDEFGKAEPF